MESKLDFKDQSAVQQEKGLKQAIALARRKARGDLLGASDPFSAIHWMKTQRQEWQPKLEDAIIEVYREE